jgi:hypothetical protein
MDPHDNAMTLFDQAEQALRAGNVHEARVLFSEAANFEIEASQQVPLHQSRTFSILSLGAATLLERSGRYDDLEQFASYTLSSERLTPSYRKLIRESLQRAWTQVEGIESGIQISETAVEVEMSGGQVGYGIAPLTTVADKMSTVMRLLTRWFEWVSGAPYRRYSRPPIDASPIVRARVAEPTPGSFRFKVLLAEPEQRLLPGLAEDQDAPPDVIEVVTRFYSLLNDLIVDAWGDHDYLIRVKETIPDNQYRRSILNLIRDIAPDGRTVGKIAFTTQSGSEISRVPLLPAVKTRIRSVFDLESGSGQSEELEGIVRGLQLDQKWFDLVPEGSGPSRRCSYDEGEIVDEKAREYLNRVVKVRGHSRTDRRTGRQEFWIFDIELSEP